MKNLIIVLSLCFLASTIQAFGGSAVEYMTPLQKVLLQAEMKHRLTHPKKSKPRVKSNCVEVFEEQRDKYYSEICNGEDRNLEIGYGPRFTREQILNAPKGWPHLKVDVRGIKAKPIPRMSVLLGKPSFPHSDRDCEDFFEESVEVVEIDGVACRRITFESEQLGSQSYTQEYCQDSGSLKIYFN